MPNEKQYFAFISYQRKDEEWADRLRSKLEHYRLPSSLRKQDLSLPKEIRPIFRDALELAGGVLAKEIETALQNSKFLIVICSPNSAKSPWVNKEIQTFIDLGREDRIIPFIIDGTPFSDNPDAECFPPALCSLKGEKELLGININELNRDAASIKVVARMFGLKFDTLWQRYERGKKQSRNRKIGMIASIVSLFAIAALIFALIVSNKNDQLEKANSEIAQERDKAERANATLALANDSISRQKRQLQDAFINLSISERNLSISNNELQKKNIELSESKDSLLRSQSLYMAKLANEMLNEGQYIKARLLASEALPISNSYPNRPYVVEAEEAFRNSFNLGNLSNHYDCLDYLQGHTDCIEHVDISQNNKYVLSISQDKTLRIWDLKTSEQLYCFSKNTPMKAFFLSDNNEGNLLLVYRDWLVLWNIEQKKSIKGHKVTISNLSRPTIDIKRQHVIYYNNETKQIHVFDINQWRIVDSCVIPYEDINDYSIDKSLKYLAIGCGKTFPQEENNNRICIWDLNNREEIVSKSNLSESVNRITISPDGKKIAFSHFSDPNIYVANTTDLVISDTLIGHTETIRSLNFSPSNPNELLSGSYDKTVKNWKITSQEHDDIPIPSMGESWPYCLSYSNDGSMFVGGLWEKLYVWGQPQTNNAHVYDNVKKFWFSANGDCLCYIDNIEGILHYIDTKSFNVIPNMEGLNMYEWSYNDIADVTGDLPDWGSISNELGDVKHVLFTNNGKYAYVVHENDDYLFFISKILVDNSGLKILKTKDLGISISCLNDIRFSANEEYILLSFGVLSSDGVASIVMDTEKLEIVSKFDDFNSGVLMSCFIPHTSNVVSCSYDMSLKVWDYHSGKLIKPLYLHRDFVMHVSSCMNGMYFSSSGQDGLVVIWETRSWKPIEKIRFGEYTCPTVLSPNGRTIAILNGEKLLIKEIKSIGELGSR